MAKNLEEALTNIENQIGGDGRKFANLGEHLEYIEKLLGEGGGSGGGESSAAIAELRTEIESLRTEFNNKLESTVTEEY